MSMQNEGSKLRTFLAAAVVMLLGAVLLFVGESRDDIVGKLLTDFASLCISGVALLLIFDYWQKEAFFREFFRGAREAEQIQRSGITGFFGTFQEQDNWDELFDKSHHLDLLFAYSATWRNSHRHRLARMLGQDKARLNAILPDPDSEVVVSEMARRFGYTTDDLKRRILEAVADFADLGTRFPGKVRVFGITQPLTHTFYRFDNAAVITFYNHQIARSGVPTLIVERGGELFQFIRDEYYDLTEEATKTGRSRLLYPPPVLPTAKGHEVVDQVAG